MENVDEMETNAHVDDTSVEIVPGKRKRRATDSSDSNENACKKLQTKTTQPRPEFELLHFSNEVLLKIIQNLDSEAKYAFSQTCKRILELVNNSLTWSSFDFSKKPMNSAQIKVLLRNIPNALAMITEFKVRGLAGPSSSHIKSHGITVTPNMLTTLKEKCPHLEAIEIHNGYLDFRKIQLTHFPSTLRRLNLIECCTIAPRSTRLFTHIDEAMPMLEELSLEKCSWFETHDLVVFSKLPQLKRLILRGCMSLRSCVPYGSIACRFGFPKLEYLDVRDTPICDSDIQCFNITRTLREILMDCPAHMREPLLDRNGKVVQSHSADSFRPRSLDNNNDSESDDDDHTTRSQQDTNSQSDDSDDDDNDDDISGGGAVGANNETISYPEDEKPYGCNIDIDSDIDSNDEGDTSALNPSSDTTNRHYIQVILQNGRLSNITTEPPAPQLAQNSNPATNSLQCVIGIRSNRNQDASTSSHQQPARELVVGTRNNQLFIQGTNANQIVAPDAPAPNDPQQNAAPQNVAESNAAASNAPQPIIPQVNIVESNIPVQNMFANAVESNAVQRPIDGEAAVQGSAGPSGVSSGARAENPARNDGNEAGPSCERPPARPVRMSASPNHHYDQSQQLIVVHQRLPRQDENGARVGGHIELHVNPNLQNICDQSLSSMDRSHISDRCLCSFGMPRRSVEDGIIWIRAEMRPADTYLERITVRNYRSVTDITLRHLVQCAPNLQYLDVTGTSVTRLGIRAFLKHKPNVEVISHYTF